MHETENQIQKYNIETCRFGWFLLPTISYINGIETEIGLGRGYLIKETSFKRKCYQQGAIYYGASWIKNYTSNVDGYKIYLISFIKTLNAGIYPVLYTNYDQSELKLKLEAGLGYSYFGLNLGYNFHLKDYEFGKLNGWSLNFRAYIPLNKNKEFYKN